MRGWGGVVVAGASPAHPTPPRSSSLPLPRTGDLKNIKGVVDSVAEDGRIMMVVQDEALPNFKDAIGFQPRELVKYFDVSAPPPPPLGPLLTAPPGWLHAAAAAAPAAAAAGVGLRTACPPACLPTALALSPPRCPPQCGEHVKVVHGQHEGETGLVVRVEGAICYVFTDATREELRVFSRDLALAVAVASSADS